MRRWLRIALVSVLLTVLGAACWFLLLDGRAPGQRPDLVRLPDGVPRAPRGYPTPNAVYLSYLLGHLKLVDYQGEITVPDGVTEKLGVEYGRAGEKPLLLDLYRPAAPHEPTPGLVFIHGGGWKKGNRSDYKYYAVRFADRGYVVATVSYRLSGEATFPAAVEDVKCAIRWMRAHAEELGVDPDRIAAIGGSAGGHLAMMAGYTANVPDLEGNGGHGGVSSAVQAIVNLYGPCDLTVSDGRDEPVVTAFLGTTYAESPRDFERASPLFHLDRSDPPTLIIHGTVDQLVPVEQSDALAERLGGLGIPYWYDRLDGWPHTLDAAEATNARTFLLISKFLDAFLGGSATGRESAEERQVPGSEMVTGL